MKPRIHGVRQQADLRDQPKLTGTTVLVVLMWLALLSALAALLRGHAARRH